MSTNMFFGQAHTDKGFNSTDDTTISDVPTPTIAASAPQSLDASSASPTSAATASADLAGRGMVARPTSDAFLYHALCGR
jgi:hypothetical protein